MYKKSIVQELIAIFVGVLFLFPVLWLLMSSFKASDELFAVPLTLIPENFTLENYTKALAQTDFLLYFKNTAFVAVVATAITIAISALCGYGMARFKQFKFISIIFLIFLSTKMLPTEVIMSPTFEVMNKLGLINSLWGVILPTVGTMTGVFLMRQYFLEIPQEIFEAAKVDGASEWKTFYKVMLPMAKPAMIMLGIFSFGWRWNDYIWPLIVLNDPSKYTLQLALRNLSGSLNIDWGVLIAASVMSMLPVLFVFVIFQKYILGGISTSGGKE